MNNFLNAHHNNVARYIWWAINYSRKERIILLKFIAFVTIFFVSYTLSIFPIHAETISNFDSGAVVFEANCAGCHINGGNIVRRGKNLKSKALHKYKVDNEEAIANIVTNGKGIMSAYGDKLSAEEIANVSSYVLQQAATNWK